MRLTEDDFEWLDRIGVDSNRMEVIKTNQKLRDIIVDLADIWDGKESERYGNRLQNVLDELEIKEMAQFYSKENMDKFIKELDDERTIRENKKILAEVEKERKKHKDSYSNI